MRCEWEKTTLGDIASFRYGKMPDKTLVRDVATEDYYPINSGYRVTGYYPEYNISSNSLIVVARGVGGTGDVKIIRERSYLTNLSIVIDVNESYVLKEYLYYLFFLDNLAYLNSGSAQSQLTIRDLERVQVSVPAIDIQRSVIKTLSTLDEKIELNNKINENLEQQAQAIFKSWFVDFEPFQDGKFVESELGMIPDGWEAGTIGDLGEVVGGSTPSKKKSEYYTNNGIRWLTPRDLSTNGNKFVSKGEIDITNLGFENSSVRKMPKGTVLFSSRAPIGYIAIAQNEVTTNQGFKSVVPKTNIGTEYVYFFLKNNINTIEARASGSTFKEVSGRTMTQTPALIPNGQVLTDFSHLLRPYFKQQELLETENKILSVIRDTLLPKLMNGEIEVPIE